MVEAFIINKVIILVVKGWQPLFQCHLDQPSFWNMYRKRMSNSLVVAETCNSVPLYEGTFSKKIVNGSLLPNLTT